MVLVGILYNVIYAAMVLLGPAYVLQPLLGIPDWTHHCLSLVVGDCVYICRRVEGCFMDGRFPGHWLWYVA